MISHEKIEEFIRQYPVYQYAFFSPKDIDFSYRVVGFVKMNVKDTTRPGPVLRQWELWRNAESGVWNTRSVFFIPRWRRYQMLSISRKRCLPEENMKKSRLLSRTLSGSRAVHAWRCLQNPVTSVRNVPFPRVPADSPKECTPVWKAMESWSTN